MENQNRIGNYEMVDEVVYVMTKLDLSFTDLQRFLNHNFLEIPVKTIGQAHKRALDRLSAEGK